MIAPYTDDDDDDLRPGRRLQRLTIARQSTRGMRTTTTTKPSTWQALAPARRPATRWRRRAAP
eukprot:113576-Lingulodinium_polyedra.AAC.1